MLKSMSLGDHLDELRYRLVRMIFGLAAGVIICVIPIFGHRLMRLLTAPYKAAMENSGLTPKFIAIQPAEQFLVYLKTCLVFGLLLSAPWFFYQIWAFVTSGLYKRERKFVYAVAPASAVLFVAGTLFFMVMIAPLALKFFITFKTGVDYIEFSSTLQNYVHLVLALSLIFGLAFQMPIAVVFAERMGLVSIEAMANARKMVILGLVVVAAVVTPPDVISQIALAVPLYVLFEGSLVVCRILRKRQTK